MSARSRLPSNELLQALHSRSQELIEQLPAAQRSYRSDPSASTHGALALVVSEAQQLVKLMEKIRVQFEGTRLEEATTEPEALRLWASLSNNRVELRRVLPRAVAALGDGSGASAGGTSAAADTAAALRSLLHTRSMLTVEQNKVKAALSQLSTGAETLDVVGGALGEVHAAMQQAQVLVRQLLAVQSRDDVILRLSALVFVLVLVFVVVQRVFRFFPVTVYVEVE